MEGPSGVLALVLAETGAGIAALVWLPRLWGNVKRGFFILTASVAAGSLLLATLAASAAVDPATGRIPVVIAAASAALAGASLAALILRLDRMGRALGVASVPTALATLVALATIAGPGPALATAQLLAGAAFMGAVTDGLLLGHWYLVDRRLPRDLIRRYAGFLLLAVAVEAVAVGLLWLTPAPADVTGFSPLLAVGDLTSWLALGMLACTALVAVLIRASLRGDRPRAVQAATGFFYLAVITAFTAEMAAKVRFLR